MKLLVTALTILFLSCDANAQQVTQAIKQTFLTQLQDSIAHQNYRELAELCDLTNRSDLKVSRLADNYFLKPLFTKSAREYAFIHVPVGAETVPYTQDAVFPLDMGKQEQCKVATTLEVTFPEKFPDGNTKNRIPLIIKNGKLLMVMIYTQSA